MRRRERFVGNSDVVLGYVELRLQTGFPEKSGFLRFGVNLARVRALVPSRAPGCYTLAWGDSPHRISRGVRIMLGRHGGGKRASGGNESWVRS